MQQHPVPQNITGFEFKLIGFLTLRQFGYLAAAGILDFILYSAGVPLFAIILFAGPFNLFALALAFLPVNDLPFERWVAAFLKSVYSPNVRVWHREPKSIGFLEPQFSIYLRNQHVADTPKVRPDRSKLDSYLAAHRRGKRKTLVDISEERRLSQLQFSPLEAQPQVFIAPTPVSLDVAAPGQANTRFRRQTEIASEGGS